MVGGSRKLGRGGGGAGNRSIQVPPIKRPSPATPPVRLSLGSDLRGRGGASSSATVAPSTSSPQMEESFSLVRENPLNFAMAIKLVPDLVEEIKRVEAQGSTARIKFSAIPNSADGNIISVGGKNFKFSWAPEVPDLCDIYEERQSGGDGNGLLVESGTTWRKLSVQRVLDESTHNHLKKRSEEAERKFKSRKAIVLDPQNSSMKQLAAVESNPWRNKNRKEPPSRKPKSETTQAIGSHKPLKPGLSTKTPSKGNKPLVGSPLSFQPDQYGAPTSSPFTSGNLVKGHTSVPDVATTHNINKTSISDKETHSRLPSSASGDKSKRNSQTETKPSDLRRLIISLLMENHSKGMSLKALEKAIGDTMSCTARQVEPILKQIATYQAPGRYFLKQGVEIECLKKPPFESGSSPQISRHKSPPFQKFDQLPAHDPTLSTRTAVNDDEQARLRSTPGHAFDATEIVDILHDSPNLMDRKVSENSEGLQGSSSESGSGSDSDSETDGSDSGSHSKSKSRSSSESESDASSSSKQASDEDVDIMSSDDEKESNDKLRNSNLVPLKSPVQLRRPDSESVDIGNYEKHDDHVSDVVDIEKDSPMDNHEAANYSLPNQEIREHERQETQVFDRKSYAGPDSGPNDGFKPEQFAGHKRLHKGKSKKRSDDKHSVDRLHNSKRLKGENRNELVSGTISLLFGDSANTCSPDEPPQRPNLGPTDRIFSTNDPTLITGYNQELRTDSTFDSHQPAQRFSEASGRLEARSGEKNPGKHHSSARGVKYSERKSDMFEKSKESNNTASGKSPVTNGRVRILQRELSELELGEFREPGDDDNSGLKKQFGRKDSCKQLENRRMESSNSSRKKPSNKIVPDSRKLTPPNPEGVRDGSSKRKVQDSYGEDHARTHNIATPLLTQQHQSSEKNKVSESSSKSSRKVPFNAAEQKHDPVLGVVSRSTKESKKQKTSKVGDSKKRKDAPLTGILDGSRKRSEYSHDENFYAKYEEEPELKGPIKDAAQYKEYVKEYQEKYESYCSLNKVLESYRVEFSNLGKDLETCKDRDMKKYHDILGQIRSSFLQCGEKHKRLKKIFVVLHEELKHLKQMIKDYAASYAKV